MTEPKSLERFASNLVRKPIDQATLVKARAWYLRYAGTFAVPMEDREVVELYTTLQQ